MKRNTTLILFFAAMILSNLHVSAQELKKVWKNPRKSFSPYLNDYLNFQMDNIDDPGIAASIIIKGKVSLRNMKGVEERTEDLKLLTSTSSFYLASVTKPMTAQLILNLLAEKKIEGQQNINSILTNLPDYMKEISIEDLLSHQSGIPSYYEFITWREEVIDNEYVLRLLNEKFKDLNFKPGTKYEYSNSNYILLAEIIEAITGQPYEKVLQDHVFAKVGMKNSSVNKPQTGLHPAIGYLFNENEKTYRINDYQSIQFPNGQIFGFNKKTYGSSGVFSTISDLEKWTIHLLDNHYFETFENGRHPIEGYAENSVENVYYTNGWFKGKMMNYDVFWHSGEFGGYRNMVLCLPELELGLVILSNNGKFNAESTGLEWAQHYIRNL